MSRPRFQRQTRQRQVILEELMKLESHPTAPVLHDLVRRRLPSISLATVYRNLDLLAEMGHVAKLGLSGEQARFDGNVHPHDHVRCVRCGRVDDLEAVPLAELPDGGQERAGYQILGRRLEFFGICPECRKIALKHTNPPSKESLEC